MNEHYKHKFGINVNKMFKDTWSFGSGITHDFCGETYLFINFAVWSISIGWMITGNENERGDL